MARRCFYSFHYKPDCHRASQVRMIGAIEGNRPATDNEWEAVTSGKDPAIERWIHGQMDGKSCCIVLVGAETADRKWIDYEILKAWNSRMGVVGIRIHGLKNLNSLTSTAGANPFAKITIGENGPAMSSVVKCYDPPGADSKERYAWICKYLEAAVEEAIKIRQNYVRRPV